MKLFTLARDTLGTWTQNAEIYACVYYTVGTSTYYLQPDGTWTGTSYWFAGSSYYSPLIFIDITSFPYRFSVDWKMIVKTSEGITELCWMDEINRVEGIKLFGLEQASLE